jgi:hypothetical protein
MNCILHYEMMGKVIVYLDDTFLTDPLWVIILKQNLKCPQSMIKVAVDFFQSLS